MSPMTPDDDRIPAELSAALRGEPALEPPAAVDAAILAAARAAVGADAEVVALPVRRRKPWIAPLALAASLVLAVGVGLQLQQEEAGPPRHQRVAPPSSPAAETAPAGRAETSAADAAQKPAATLEKRSRAASRALPEAAAPMPPATPRAEPPPAKLEAPSPLTARSAPAPAAAAPMTRPTQPAVSADTLRQEGEEEGGVDADLELAAIRRLVEAERLDEARQRLRAFVERWPDRQLPEDLANRLDQSSR